MPAMVIVALRGLVTLTIAQAEMVTRSDACIAADPADFSALFYHRLFERHPFVRSLFPDDMASQVGIFREKVHALMAAIDDLLSFHADLAALGARHVGYGVKPRHYDAVGEVLIDTFAEMAGETFDQETRAAWSTLYAEVTAIMLAAAPEAT